MDMELFRTCRERIWWKNYFYRANQMVRLTILTWKNYCSQPQPVSASVQSTRLSAYHKKAGSAYDG
jgi:hypothetical protein